MSADFGDAVRYFLTTIKNGNASLYMYLCSHDKAAMKSALLMLF
jgi:hypothetical protein